MPLFNRWLTAHAGVFVLMVLIPLVATDRQSAKFVFTSLNTDNGVGIHSEPYIFLLGLLMSQYTLSGYDASAHMVAFDLFDPKTYFDVCRGLKWYLGGTKFCRDSIYGQSASCSFMVLDVQSEETKSSDRNGAYGILSSVILSVVFGWAYIVGITFAVVDPQHLLDPGNDTKGYAIAQVFHDVFNSRYGSGVGGIVCLGVVAVTIWFCGMSSVTSNSRYI